MRNFLPKFTKRQWLTLIIIGLADFCNAICVSLQAPFFPQEVSFYFVIQNFGFFFNILASFNLSLIKLFALITRVKSCFRLSKHYNNNPIKIMCGHEIRQSVEIKHKMCIKNIHETKSIKTENSILCWTKCVCFLVLCYRCFLLFVRKSILRQKEPNRWVQFSLINIYHAVS